jgi:hypothetical protein
MAYKSKIDRIIKKFNLDSDVEKKKAYQACIEYADKHYSNTYDINPFLKEAADRLTQQYVVKNAIYGMVKSNGLELATLAYSENYGPTLTVNKSGLRFLSKLFLTLSKCKMYGEHVHLWNNKLPMTGKTFPLTIYCEKDDWFAAQHDEVKIKKDDSKNEIPTRNIDPESIIGIVFTKPNPPTLSLTPMRSYKVIACEKYSGQKVWRKMLRKSQDRMMVFTLIDDAKEKIDFALDLDDPEFLLLI